jgi:hypothetical protein
MEHDYAAAGVGHFMVDGPSLRDAFQSSHLVLRTSRAGGFGELRRPPFREVFRDGSAVIYRIE